jgi:hypothetical protein
MTESTCFVCGNRAKWTDKTTGESLCTQHYHPLSIRPVKPQRTITEEWSMREAIRIWHGGSAYAKDQAMAKRLERT